MFKLSSSFFFVKSSARSLSADLTRINEGPYELPDPPTNDEIGPSSLEALKLGTVVKASIGINFGISSFFRKGC